ncbi:hypothetical protein ACVIHC_000145 [Bradyrhizobium diazoefficiens]
MANALARTVEPFVDRVSPNEASANSPFFRVGYRTEDDVLSSIDLPVDVLEEEIVSGLQLIVRVTPSGEVRSEIVGSAGLTLLGPRLITSIDDLVSQAVCKDNLHLEEASAKELISLLRILESAIDHVETALAQARAGA